MKKLLRNSLLTLFLSTLIFSPLKVNAIENKYFGEDSINKTKCDLK
ncbi:Uncharacterised protein [Clostridium tertium]|uniref:Uncharacterized protein n=1 Tax=Clostridium tertium TaxID=1559 RepID=A0A6N3A845_9CLOT